MKQVHAGLHLILTLFSILYQAIPPLLSRAYLSEMEELHARLHQIMLRCTMSGTMTRFQLPLDRIIDERPPDSQQYARALTRNFCLPRAGNLISNGTSSSQHSLDDAVEMDNVRDTDTTDLCRPWTSSLTNELLVLNNNTFQTQGISVDPVSLRRDQVGAATRVLSVPCDNNTPQTSELPDYRLMDDSAEH